jgi:hypothetical protein
MIRVGRLLAEARTKLKAQVFSRWVEVELPWSRAHTYRLIAVAEAFGNLIEPGLDERIEPTALYLLARIEVPAEARAYAIELSATQIVTTADAREILDSHRPVRELSKEAIEDIEEPLVEVRRAEGKEKAKIEMGQAELAAVWDALRNLVIFSTMLHIAENAEEEDEPLYAITVYSDGKPRTVIRRTLALAILAAAGREPVKWCGACKESHPVSAFSANRNQPDGLARYCRASEVKRVARSKKRKAGEKG